MEGKKIGKIVISVLTIGVTATAAYYGYKAVKRHLDKKKAAKEAAAAKAANPAPDEKTIKTE